MNYEVICRYKGTWTGLRVDSRIPGARLTPLGIVAQRGDQIDQSMHLDLKFEASTPWTSPSRSLADDLHNSRSS